MCATMSSMAQPLDVHDLSSLWHSLDVTSRKALTRLCILGDPPGTWVSGVLSAAGCIAPAGTAWGLTVRGYQLVAWAVGAGMLP